VRVYLEDRWTHVDAALDRIDALGFATERAIHAVEGCWSISGLPACPAPVDRQS